MENDNFELNHALREWEAPETPDWLEARVLARRNARRRMRFVAVAAMAAVLGALTFLAIRTPSARTAAPTASPEDSFVPVPNVLPLDCYETGRVVRVDVRISALIAAGYSLPLSDPAAKVKVDLLVGEDGRVHAVRLVGDSILSGTGD